MQATEPPDDTGTILPRRTRDAQPYWEGLAAGKLLFQRCDACHQATFPPRYRCPTCATGASLTWQESRGIGAIYSYSAVHRAPIDALQPRTPYTLGFVQLDEDYFMFAEILAPVEAIRIGMRVAVRIDAHAPHLPRFAPLD